MHICNPNLLVLVSLLLLSPANTQSEVVEKRERSNELGPPTRLLAGDDPIHVPGFAAPYFEDFDGDGLSDLLVGQLEHGRLRIYRNVGSGKQPQFNSFQWFEAGNRIAGVPTGCAVGFTPQLTDWDGDGRTDILTGSFQGGLLFVFRRQEDGSFAESEVLQNANNQVRIVDSQYNSTAFLHDWDNDGDKDLIAGRRLCWVRNDGTNQNPKYGEAQPLVPKEKNASGIPCIADWDGDGLDDLIVANIDVAWYRNIGTANQPKLDDRQLLIHGNTDLELEVTDDQRKLPARIYSACVADFDSDGRLDLLVGDHHYKKTEDSAEDNAEFQNIRAWRSDFSKRYYDLIRGKRKVESDTTHVAVFRDALKSWDDLAAIPFDGPQHARYGLIRHGGVWLYRRFSN